MRAYYDPDQVLHDPQQFMRAGRICAAQDVPARTDVLLGALRSLDLIPEVPQEQGLAPILAVHASAYVDFLRTGFDRWMALPSAGPEILPNLAPYWNATPDQEARPPCPSQSIIAQAGYYVGDLAAPIGRCTWTSALASARTAIAAADAILAQEGVSYGLCRPSGHHARRDRASGFCYLNNAAIAAERLRTGFQRVAVLDLDAHHGDGTQQIFYRRADVLTVSIHADPAVYYPFFTGFATERGAGAGERANINLPLKAGADDATYLNTLDSAIQAIVQFDADALVIALGFDIHANDPIGILKVSTAAFDEVGARVGALHLPTVIIQEGGYGLPAIAACLRAFLTGFRTGSSSQSVRPDAVISSGTNQSTGEQP